jgi:hypothetical protein
MVWGFSNKKLISVEDYSMIFKLHEKRRYSAKKNEREGELLLLICSLRKLYVCIKFLKELSLIMI